jgi:hypothetical protein
VAKRKPVRKPKPRSKLTIEIETRRKRRLMAFCGARGERPSQVLARAIDQVTAGFKFEGAGSSADCQPIDSPILKIG